MKKLKRTLPLLCLAAFPVLTGLAGLQPAPQDDTNQQGERGYPWNRISNARNDELMEQMEGAWRLVRAVMTDLNNEARNETGVLLFTKDYMSLEIHMGWSDPVGGLKDWDFQSGTYRVSLDSLSILQLRTEIGSYFNEEGDIEFENYGMIRSYRPQVHGNKMTLTSTATGSMLEFRRMENPSIDKKRDLFGRPIKEKPEEEEDSLFPPAKKPGDDR